MRKLAGIPCVEYLNDPQAPWLILFHGYGADAHDLAGLVDFISTKKPLNFLFPQGIQEVPIGPGWTGRAWWTLDINQLMARQAGGGDYDMSGESPAGLPSAREKAMKMISELGVSWDQIFLGGFSQGGMLAVDLALHAPQNPKGLVILSSSILNKAQWKEKIAARAGVEFFMSHGSHDDVLTLRNAQRLETFLTQSGLKGRLLPFQGAHEIPPVVIQKLITWLDERL